MRTVVCGVDHSGAAPAVASTGARLARDAGARLVLAHVRAPAAAATALAHEPLALPSTTCPEQDAALLEHLATRAGYPRAAVRTLSGDPSRALCRLAGEEQADLLVVGTRGLGAVGRALLGSVSSDVVRRAPCPAVVVPPACPDDRRPSAGRTIVAGIGAAGDRIVAECAASLAIELGLELRLAHVVAPAPEIVPPLPGVLAPLRAKRDGESQHRAVARLLYELVDDLLSADRRLRAGIEIRIAAGDAAAELGALAQREDAAALVVGARRGGALREVLGVSTASDLIRGAPTPVVVCRDGRR